MFKNGINYIAKCNNVGCLFEIYTYALGIKITKVEKWSIYVLDYTQCRNFSGTIVNYP